MNWKNRIRIFKSVLIYALVFSVTSTLKAQNINGLVTDILNKPISYATITLSRGGLILAYSTTNQKGIYSISPPKTIDSSYVLEVSCIGYRKQKKALSDNLFLMNFSLLAETTELKSVTVRANWPKIKINGDTISYKASDFTNSNDKVIGDVLKRIPGIDVSPDGKISYNGKSISNFYIDGDNLLDDKYNIATNTIPNKVVDKVQILENHQPIKILQNRQVTNNVALNLTIKDEAKLNVVGQETIGAGIPGKYIADLNALFLKKKYKTINYIKANDIGYDLQNDLVEHSLDDYLKRIENVKPTPMVSIGSTIVPDIEREKYLFNRSGIINLNNLINLKNQVQVKINAYYLINDQNLNFSKITKVYLPGDTIKYTELQKNHFNQNIFHNAIAINVNKDNYYINDNLITDYTQKNNSSNLISNQIPISQHSGDKLSNFSNEFNIIQSTKVNKNIIEIYSYINHFSEPQNMTIDPGPNPLFINKNNPYSQLIQYVNTPNWLGNSYISYNVKSKASIYTFRLGAIIQSQRLSSQLLKRDLNSIILPAIDSATNSLKWQQNKFYLENSYSYIYKKFEVTGKVPLIFRSINYSDRTYLADTAIKRLFVNFQMLAKLYVGQENYIELTYKYYDSWGTMQDVFNGYILTDYRTLSDNNAPLGESKNQMTSLFYTYKKSTSLFFYYIGVSFNNTSTNNIASSIISNTFERHITLPFPNSKNFWIVNSAISKYLFSLHTSLTAGFSLQSFGFNQIQNGENRQYNTITKDATLKIDSKINSFLNFSYKGEFKTTSNSSNGITDKSIISQLQQQSSLNFDVLKSLVFTVTSDNYLIHSTELNNSYYNFIDITGRYKPVSSKLEFSFNLMNVLNNKSYKSVNLAGNLYSSSTYTLPGRFVLLKITFNL